MIQKIIDGPTTDELFDSIKNGKNVIFRLENADHPIIKIEGRVSSIIKKDNGWEVCISTIAGSIRGYYNSEIRVGNTY